MPDASASPPASAAVLDQRWLSLGPASKLLGVDPDTLRRWADEGRVPAWTTPGGHRRFDRAALERLARDRRPGRPGRVLADLGASPERLTRAYRRQYAAAPAGAPSRAAAAAASDVDAREAYRQEGRQLITALLAFLDAPTTDARGRARAESEATALVDGHGARAAAAGISLTEAIEHFVAARQPFLAELANLGKRRSLDPSRLAALYDDASTVLDRLLLRFIAAHQRHTTG